MIDGLIAGLMAALQWDAAVALVGGTILGIFLSAMPGMSGTLSIALAIPFTYGLSPFAAIGLLAGIHNGTSQGGAIPAVLLNIPGTPGAVCTAWDGYPLAQQGHAGAAINLAAYSSAVGGVLGALSLMLLAPPLALAALAFSTPELFWVNLFGIVAIASMLGEDRLKGLIAAAFGILIGTIGTDMVTGVERLTFGVLELYTGLTEVAVMVGMFAFPPTWEIAVQAIEKTRSKFTLRYERGIWRVAQVWKVWLKSSLIGIGLGILPGSAIGAFLAYSVAKNDSKEPEKFGHGSVEGLAAAESVNNADNAAAMIPALTLGVPGSSVAALMMGALLIQGFQVGPQLFHDSPDIVFGYGWMMLISSMLLVVFGGVLGSRVFANVLKIPAVLILPLIVVVVVTGTFSSENTMFNVYVALIFGVIGLLMRWGGFPVAPAIIGFVLGGNAEFNLRVSLQMSFGDPSILFLRPICIILILMIIFVLTYPFLRRLVMRRWRPSSAKS